VRGTILLLEGGNERPFSGWMELSDQIAAAHEGRVFVTEATTPTP
jgi:hypothetical protein